MLPNKYTYCALFSACAHAAVHSRAVELDHHFLTSGIELDTMLSTSMIDMFTKCGDLQRAADVFKEQNSEMWWMWVCGMQ
jgi:hypothetical protein